MMFSMQPFMTRRRRGPRAGYRHKHQFMTSGSAVMRGRMHHPRRLRETLVIYFLEFIYSNYINESN